MYIVIYSYDEYIEYNYTTTYILSYGELYFHCQVKPTFLCSRQVMIPGAREKQFLLGERGEGEAIKGGERRVITVR